MVPPRLSFVGLLLALQLTLDHCGLQLHGVVYMRALLSVNAGSVFSLLYDFHSDATFSSASFLVRIQYKYRQHSK